MSFYTDYTYLLKDFPRLRAPFLDWAFDRISDQELMRQYDQVQGTKTDQGQWNGFFAKREKRKRDFQLWALASVEG